MKWSLALFFVFLAQPSLATDCNTNCEKACTNKIKVGGLSREYLDPACKARCETEKAVSCRTGLTSCDTWRISYYQYFVAARQAVTYSSEQRLIKDVHDCHRLVDRAATGAGIASGIYNVWQYGLEAVKNISIAGFVVSEGVKHFAHCVCTESRYAEVAASGVSANLGFYRTAARPEVYLVYRPNFYFHVQNPDQMNAYGGAGLGGAYVTVDDTGARHAGKSGYTTQIGSDIRAKTRFDVAQALAPGQLREGKTKILIEA